MKYSILSKKTNITLICVLAFIYLGCATVSILGIDSSNFYYKYQFDSIEILSAVIFIVSIIIGLKDTLKLFPTPSLDDHQIDPAELESPDRLGSEAAKI